MKLSVIILAAGKGTRMKSELPKVMHPVAGKPMVQHVYERSRELQADDIHIVYGHGGEALQQACADFDASWIEQAQQLGTAHAVQQAMPQIDDDHLVLVLYGDVPLIKTATLQQLVNAVEGNDISLLTVTLENPDGYGRIVRDANDDVIAIVEHKDADDRQKMIREINTGILAVRAGYLRTCLERIGNDNAQGEYYLTDLVELAVADGNRVVTSHPQNTSEVEGINDRAQLAALERVKQAELAQALMREGVHVIDPARIDIRGDLSVAADTSIDINCVFSGKVNIGSGCSIGAGCIIQDCDIADNVTVKPYSILESASLESDVEVGPFARLRPGARLLEGSRVGNFVEMKNTVLGHGSKANHLTYLGDTEVGSKVNIGAGTITCNYDGANKHKTVIGDGAFIGSDTQLVAPVTIGRNVTIGAGATITRDTDDDVLVISRVPQKTITGWIRPRKK